MRRVLATLALAGVVVARELDANACVSVGLQPLVMQQPGTGQAPGPVGDVTYTITRGKGPQSAGCGTESSTSCDDVGTVVLHFKPATDPDGDGMSVGYRIRVVRGALPPAITLPTGPVTAPDGDIALDWADGATDEQEPIDFTLTLTPVDANGNVGPTSPEVRVVNAGNDGGCSVTGGSGGSGVVLMMVIGASLVRRLRRRAGRIR